MGVRGQSLKPEIDDVENAPAGYVFGLDEVGRGCIAGPVVAACYAYPLALWREREISVRVHDSKKLSAEQRRETSLWLRDQTDAVYAVCEASVAEIDRLNILWASMLAMERAFMQCVAELEKKLGATHTPRLQHRVLIDGDRLPKNLQNLPPHYSVQALVKGDSKSFAIAAASILAKVQRDHFMNQLATDFPAYHWQSNVGYPTPAHKVAVREHGLSEWHRRSFSI